MHAELLLPRYAVTGHSAFLKALLTLLFLGADFGRFSLYVPVTRKVSLKMITFVAMLTTKTTAFDLSAFSKVLTRSVLR